jgi:hypothetical protein
VEWLAFGAENPSLGPQRWFVFKMARIEEAIADASHRFLMVVDGVTFVIHEKKQTGKRASDRRRR